MKTLALKILCTCWCWLSLPGLLQAQLQWQSLNEPGCGGFTSSIAISPHNTNKLFFGGDVMGAGYSTDAGGSWNPTFGFKSWEIGEFTFHPTDANIIWVGTMSGPYISTDGGNNWEERRNGMPAVEDYYTCPVQQILYDPADTDRLIAFGGSHTDFPTPGGSRFNVVWESLDGGQTWDSLTTIGTMQAPGITRAAWNGSKLVAVSMGQGVYFSSDGGGTWAPSNTGMATGNVWWVEPHPNDTMILWASTGPYFDSGDYIAGKVYRSTDGGANWTDVSGTLTQIDDPVEAVASRYKCVRIAPSDPDILFTGNSGFGSPGLFKSTDGGLNWVRVMDETLIQTTPIFYDFSAPDMVMIAIDPYDENKVYAGGGEYVLRSADGGNTWDDIMSEPAGPPGFYTGNGFSGIVTSNFEFNPFDPDHAVNQGADDGKYNASFDNLQTWRKGGTGMDEHSAGNDVVFAGINGRVIYMTSGQNDEFEGVYRSDDQGDSWVKFTHADFPGATPMGGSPMGIHALPDQPDTAWVIVQDMIFRTNNGGTNWTPLTLPGSGLALLAAAKNDPLTFYVNTAGGVYQTTDGTIFTQMPGSPSNGTRIEVDPNNDSMLYVTKWRTDDGEEGLWKYDGSTWNSLLNNYYVYDVAVQPGNSQTIIVCTDEHPFKDYAGVDGMLLSTDGGETWSPENNGLPMLRGSVITFNPHDPGQLIFGTSGRGFFAANIQGPNAIEATGIPPNRFLVYPSPTSGKVYLSNILETHLPIQVIDLMGRKRMEIRDITPVIDLSRLRDGIYFIRSGTTTRKIMLCR